MNKTDLEAVIERRAMLVREVAELEKLRSELEEEDRELQVAERVLRRLAEGVRIGRPRPPADVNAAARAANNK